MTSSRQQAAEHSAADWAASVAERLPSSDVRALARAAAEGASAVGKLRAQAAAPVLRDACDQLVARLASIERTYLAGLLDGTIRAVERARRHLSIDVVWTGPESSVMTSRLTAATVIGLIEEARHEIVLVSFATHAEPSISAALESAVDRSVSITLLAERHADNPAYSSAQTPFPDIDAIRLHWPASLRPPGAALHAKIIVVDDHIALVSRVVS
jgi:phosphatidylserine/phosphatidylglycerophosphate/cardiolipin synthase-like enzyme